MSKHRSPCTSFRDLLPALVAACALTACYSDLQDEEEFRTVAINTDGVRSPNQPPGAAATSAPTGTGTGTAPAPTASTPAGPMFTAGCEDVVTSHFASEMKCGGALCHGGPGTKPIYFNLGDPEGLKERVLDKPGTICPDLKIVDSADPSKSAILHKLEAMPSCGQHMPVARELTPADVTCLTEWVTAMASGQL